MDLSIIIVNWNVRDLLEKCLASIYRETRNIRFEVIVVDNASNDGSALMIKTKFPKVRLIENKENKWFAGGNNQGFAAAQGELVLLLNPDTEILDGAINKMVGIMKEGREGIEKKLEIGNWKLENNHIGVLGCKLLNSDISLQPSCRRLPRLFDQILILLKLHNFFPRLKPVRDYYMSDFDYNLQDKNSNIGRVKGPDLPRVEQGPLTLPMRAREVEQVMGACLMTRKEIIDKIGGLDEEYGAHFEEVDFCKRVLGISPNPSPRIPRGKLLPRRGKIPSPSEGEGQGEVKWKIYFTPEAQIIHHKGQSFRQRKIITNQKNFNRALLRYFRKYESFWQYLIILLLWPVSMFLASVDQMMNLAGIRGFKARFKKTNY